MEVRDGPKERRDGDAIESELCECFFALHELVTTLAVLCEGWKMHL